MSQFSKIKLTNRVLTALPTYVYLKQYFLLLFDDLRELFNNYV